MSLIRLVCGLTIAAVTTWPASGADAPAPIPPDANELVTTAPQAVPVAGPEHAAVAKKLREAVPASRFSGVYDVTITLATEDANHNPLLGDIEEVSIPSGAQRWTGHLGSFTIERVMVNEETYETRRAEPIPLRLYTARRSIFSTNPGGVPKFLRTVQAEQNGMPLTCILGAREEVTTPGRDWKEAEHCVDDQGLLRVYSEAPGQYIVYHYDAGTKYQDRAIPSGVTIYQNGKPVMEEKIAIRVPGTVDLTLFRPGSEMHAPAMEMAAVLHREGPPRAGKGPLAAPVMVHGALTADGKVAEAEPLGGDAETSAEAVERVRRMRFESAFANGTAQAREFFVLVQ
jgi:hypothetical protein